MAQVTKRRGYTTYGYPIVWKRYGRKNLAFEHGKDWLELEPEEQEALVHEHCMEKLAAQEEEGESTGAPSAGGAKKIRKAGKFTFAVSADAHCLHLIVGNHTSYYQTLGALARAVQKRLVREKIGEKGQVTDIKTLIQIERESTKEVLEAFDTLPKFEVKEV